jgi:hypothetical protein
MAHTFESRHCCRLPLLPARCQRSSPLLSRSPLTSPGAILIAGIVPSHFGSARPTFLRRGLHHPQIVSHYHHRLPTLDIVPPLVQDLVPREVPIQRQLIPHVILFLIDE